MTVSLDTRFDITLDALRRVAWQGEPVALSRAALARIAETRAAFLDYVACDPAASVYGVNRGQGEMIHQGMDDEAVTRLARLKPLAAAVSFGEPYPERVVRAMVLARFANLLEGHAAATPRLAEALVDLLNEGPLPVVSSQGQGGAGEILVLYPLFAELSRRFALEPGERGALVNGAPAAGALLADAALVAERRLSLVHEVLALAIEAFNAPLEHYDPALGELWGGSHNEAAFGALSRLLDRDGPDRDRRDYQAPVCYRIIPALLGQAQRALDEARRLAGLSLAAVSHNPVYLPPDAEHRRGRCLSTGGYHNAVAAPAMDELAATDADLCLLCERLCVALLNGRVTGYPDFLLSGRRTGESDGHGAVGYLPMAIVGYVEEARGAAQRSFVPAADASVFGQDDVASPAFLAWPKAMRAGSCLDASLAVLAVTASQALHVTGRTRLPAVLAALLARVRALVPPVEADRVLAPELDALRRAFTAQVLEGDEA